MFFNIENLIALVLRTIHLNDNRKLIIHNRRFYLTAHHLRNTRYHGASDYCFTVITISTWDNWTYNWIKANQLITLSSLGNCYLIIHVTLKLWILCLVVTQPREGRTSISHKNSVWIHPLVKFIAFGYLYTIISLPFHLLQERCKGRRSTYVWIERKLHTQR